MKIINGSRGSGRTEELLLWLLEGHARGVKRVLIVANEMERRALNKKLFLLWEESGRSAAYINNAANSIHTVETFRKAAHGNFFEEFAVSDADLILGRYLGYAKPTVLSFTDLAEVITLPEKNPQPPSKT